MTEKISNNDFYFAIACFIQSSVLITSYTVSEIQQETWFIAILAFVISVFIVLLYSWLIKRFQGQGLYDVLYIAYGKIFGKILVFSYLLFFLLVLSVNIRDTADFSIVYILPDMHLWLVIVSFTALVFFAVQSGIQNLVRYGFVFFFITSLILLINLVLLSERIDFSNFLPLFSFDFIKYLKGTQFVTSVSFCETIVFLTLAPFIEQPAKISKTFIIGIILGFISLVIIVFCEIAVLGATVSILSTPYYAAVRLISTFDVFTRLETLFSFLLLVMKFFKISILFFAVSTAISKLINKKLNLFSNLLTAVLVIIVSLNFVDSNIELQNFGGSIYPFVLSTFEILLPIITFCIIKFKKL